MNTKLITKHGATYFTLLSPSENLSAIFDGSLGDILFEGILPITIHVYMLRSATHRNEVANYQLRVNIKDKS